MKTKKSFEVIEESRFLNSEEEAMIQGKGVICRDVYETGNCAAKYTYCGPGNAVNYYKNCVGIFTKNTCGATRYCSNYADFQPMP